MRRFVRFPGFVLPSYLGGASLSLALLALLPAAGCSREPQRSDESLGRSAAALNANPNVGDFALYATNSISLGEQALVVGGDVGVENSGPGLFLGSGFALVVGEKAQVNPARSLLADSVLLRERAVVGDIQTNHLFSTHATHGSVTPFIPLPAFPTVAPVLAGATDLNVPQRTTVVLPASASFKNVTIGESCTVRLAGGIYQVAQLTVGEKSRIEALATVEIHVAGRLSVGSSVFLGPTTAGLTARDLRIEVSGINDGGGGLSGTPVAAALGEKEQVRALMLVPNGTLRVGGSVLAYGALFGRDVKIGETSQINFQDGFGAAGCSLSCDDGNPCTNDACVAGACAHTPTATGTPCNDGNSCTQLDTCQAGTCVGANPVTCTALDPCHNVGTCDPASGTCSTPAKADGTACNDDNSCTQVDTCQAGACTGTSPKTCTALDPCHAAGTCDPSTGACSNPAVADGTTCNDGNACTQTDACHGGSCIGAGPVPCLAIDQCHAAGTCDPSTGQCSTPSVPDGTACSDGNACTQVDVCVAGLCAGTSPVVCVALDQCHVAGACDPSSGVCSSPAQPDGTSCSDGNACTQTDRCLTGTCTGSNPVACTASDQCHVAGTCDSSTGVCSNPSKGDGTSCDDGNACTSADSCESGACHAGTPVAIDDSNPCTADSCDPALGVKHVPTPAGSSCSDGNACNGAETCDGNGACRTGTAVVCAALDQCHQVGACDPSSGACSNPAKPDGNACDDGNRCTQSDSCQVGACVGDSPVTCAALDQCHNIGTCDPASGVCSNPAKSDGTACNDGNGCTQTDQCLAGACTGSNPVVCTAGDQCHVAGSCDSASGICSNPAKTDGSGCDDGNACTSSDACQGGNCQAGAPVPVEDNNPCTTDTCDPLAGVQHVPAQLGSSCSDDNACNGAETCDGNGACRSGTAVVCAALDQCHDVGTCDASSGTCSNPVKTDGTSCDDGNLCTQSDVCQGGACLGSNPTLCTALDSCHAAGTCNPQTGICSNPNAPNGTGCSDGNACTQTDSCQAGLCVGSNPVGCQASDSCHFAGSCDSQTGTCSNPPAPDGTSCNASNACTTNDLCQAGICQPGTQVSIDDGNPCTLDTCDAVNGVVHHACSPIDRTVGTTLADVTSFLYSGAQPIQTGVAPGTIVATTASVLRGRVLAKDGTGLPGVAVTIVNHTEFGSTLTHGDGSFDMAVNGGQTLRVGFARSGYLPAERLLQPAWKDYALATDVVLLQVDQQVTTVDLTAADVQVARGTAVTDSDGTRQATIFVPPSTHATMTLPDHSTVTLDALRVRATEYSVGPNGPKAMPAELPSTSAYTYAVELSADEALSAGATQVAFSQPLPFYVENFLGFPVGEAVPSGFFDQNKGAWVPSDNGVVLKIITVSGGLADVDLTGDGVADTGPALSAIGITDQERQHLASLYAPGQTLWRVPVSHFSKYDLNWGFAPPNNGGQPNAGGPGGNGGSGPGGCDSKGSRIGCQRQTLGEQLPVVGTPYSLHYESDRQSGRLDADTIQIPLSGPTLAGPVKSIELEIQVAGRLFTQSFPAQPNQRTTFTWDGKDSYGRILQGSQPISVRVGNTYDGVYTRVSKFGYNGNGIPITGSKTRREVTLWSPWNGSIGPWDSLPEGLGGWSLSVHHSYDVGGTLHLGDGTDRTAASLPVVIKRVAGNGQLGNAGDGGPATSAILNTPTCVAVAPDGAFYMGQGGCIRKVGTDGIIHTIAGNCLNPSFGGDGGPAASALLHGVQDLVFGPDGSLYVADSTNLRIRKIDPSGIITTVVGSGVQGFSGDGGPATLARLGNPWGVDVTPDGTLYIADLGNQRIRRVSPDGIITTVAGGASGPPGSALAASLNGSLKVRAGSDGSFYIVESNGNVIRRVGTDGIIRVFAGNGGFGFSGDGGPATAATLRAPQNVVIGRDGSVYIRDQNNIVRQVTPDGLIATVVGAGRFVAAGGSGDNGPAKACGLATTEGMTLAPDGSMYLPDGQVVRRVTPVLPGFSLGTLALSSEDGSQVYAFDGHGRHLQTIDTLTKAVLYQFGYDAAGRLATITDVDGNLTTIDHDSNGSPINIVGPFGQTTALAPDVNGYLASATNPANEITQFTYTTDGLMQTMIDPRGGLYQFSFDGLGLLIEDQDSAGGFQTLVRSDVAGGFLVSLSTALGRHTSYQTQLSTTGVLSRLNTLPNGTHGSLQMGLDSVISATEPDGTVTTSIPTPDPRFGMLSPINAVSIKTPSGLTMSESTSRSTTLTNPADPFSLSTLTEQRTINGKTWTRAFDATARTWTTTSPVGRKSVVTLDAKSHVASKQLDSLLAATFGYDARGHLTTINQGSRTQTFGYGSDGWLSSSTDALSQTTQFVRDSVGRVTALVEPDSTIVGFGYDADGNLTAVTPPSKPTHNEGYTPVDLLQSYTPPTVAGSGLTSTTYSYDLDRMLSQILRPDNQVVSYLRDSAGRPSTLTLPTGTITYGYSPTTGKLTSMTGPYGETMTLGYDGTLLTDLVYSGVVPGALHWTYDNNFRRASETVNGSSAATFGYDNDGLLTQAGVLALVPGALNGLLSGTTLGSVTDSYGYNSFGEVDSYSTNYAGATLFSESFAPRDALGRIAIKTATIQGTTQVYAYMYDRLGRLTDAMLDGSPVTHYGYDSNGNRLERTASGSTLSGTYDDQDRMLSYGDSGYTYGANGELASKTVGGQTAHYLYDVLGNLIQVSLPGTTIDYIVDSQGHRLGKKLNGTLVQGFLWDRDLRIIAELDGTGALVSRFVYGRHVSVPEYMVRGADTFRFVYDHLGTVRLVVRVSDGMVAQRVDYDEFGNATLASGSWLQPFGFAGGLYDPDTKLVRFGARDYDAETGRWTSKDPIRFAGGNNLYVYSGNDPVNRVDPSGRFTPCHFLCWLYIVATEKACMMQSGICYPDPRGQCPSVVSPDCRDMAGEGAVECYLWCDTPDPPGPPPPPGPPQICPKPDDDNVSPYYDDKSCPFGKDSAGRCRIPGTAN